MSGAERFDPGVAARVVVGVGLFVTGVVLWLVLDASWCGLISGFGVVVLYPIAGARIEAWRARQRADG